MNKGCPSCLKWIKVLQVAFTVLLRWMHELVVGYGRKCMTIYFGVVSLVWQTRGRPLVVGVLGLRTEQGMPCECWYCCLYAVDSCHRVIALLILTLFIPCSVRLYFGCATLAFALFSVVAFLTCNLYAFHLVHMNSYLKQWSVAWPAIGGHFPSCMWGWTCVSALRWER